MLKKSICILALPLLFITCLSLPAQTSSQKVTVKVMDWNVKSFGVQNGSVWTTVKPEEFVVFIKEQDPDIITFNEFATCNSWSETVSGRDARETLSNTASQLGMYAYFVESYGLGDGERYGNAILSKFPILSTASMQMPYKHSGGEGSYIGNGEPYLSEYGADQRGAGYADVLVPTDDGGFKILRVMTSHFDHMSSNARRVQAQEAAAFGSFANPEFPTVFMGDLNAIDLSGTLAPIATVADHVLVNWVDHIFTMPKGAFAATDSGSISSGNLSDHNPIVATLTF